MSGRNSSSSASGVSSSNPSTQSTADKPARTLSRCSSGFTGRPGPLSRATEASSFTATTSRSPSALGFLQVGHVAGVKNVEAAVREHHALTA